LIDFFSDHAVLFALLCSFIAIGYGIGLTVWLLRQPAGDERMREIARAIQEGAAAYLRRQYQTVAVVAIVPFLLLGFYDKLGWGAAIGFLIGAGSLGGVCGAFLAGPITRRFGTARGLVVCKLVSIWKIPADRFGRIDFEQALVGQAVTVIILGIAGLGRRYARARVAVASRVCERLRHGGLADSEETESPQLRRLRPREQGAHRLALERVSP
jgi:hypothetical protein